MTPFRLLRIFRQRLRAILRKPRVDAELRDEFAFHFEQLVKEKTTEGMTAKEARHAARRALGNLPLLEEQCRDHRRVNWLLDFGQDLRYALRQFAKDRSVAAVLVITIALGIGVNTAIFSMLNGLFRPLPVPAPEQLVVLAAETKGDDTGLRFMFSYPALEDFRRQANQFSDIFGFQVQIRGLSAGGKSTQLVYSAVTGNYFTALGVKPAAGRLFEPGEGESETAPLTLVLGYSTWQKRFGGDPGAIGRQVRMDGQSVTVIGVAPKEFHGVYEGLDMEGYMPLRSLLIDGAIHRTPLFTSRTEHPLLLFGRMKPGVTLQQAQTSMSALTRRIGEQHSETDAGIGVRVIPEPLARPLPLRSLTEVLPLVRFFVLFLVGLVLLLACMNVANVMLVRATVREREMAIRAALGSGRGRLIRQMLTESLLLALLGATAGIVLGAWASRMFAGSVTALVSDMPMLFDASFDLRVFLFSLAAALFTAAFVGIWPALRASQTKAGAALHEAGRSNSSGPVRQRTRGLLVAGQVAGSLMLLICAGLFMRSLRAAQSLDLGFVAEGVLNARMNPHWAGYDLPRTKDFYRELEHRVKAWPEVRSASLAYSAPMSHFLFSGDIVHIEGRPVAPGEQPLVIGYNTIDAGYFDTMQIRIERGRALRESDTETSPLVAVVNQTMASRYWPNQDPLGKRFRMHSETAPLFQVVGVAHDSKYMAVFEGSLPHFYVPLTQVYSPMRVLQIRSSVPAAILRTRLEREIDALDPNITAQITTMEDNLKGAQGFWVFRVGAFQAACLGMLGLILAVVGVYGVVSYGAAQRTREVGIRIALGATPRAILQMILSQGIWMVVCGVAMGLAGAAALTRVLGQFLLLISARDPLTFLAVPAALALVALWACYIPARRATRVDPMVVLRHE